MNDNFDFNNQENQEAVMSREEIRSHKSIFSKICFSLLVYMLVSEGLGIVVTLLLKKFASDVIQNGNYILILNFVIQYCAAFPVFCLLIRRIPKRAPARVKLTAGEFFKYAFISMFIMFVGNYISVSIMSYIELIMGSAPENSVSELLSDANILLSALIVGIIGPIVEELMFRKFLIDRLSPYSQVIAVFFPALLFGLFHGNLYQFFYAFFLGVAFSYIYVKTGKIVYSTVLHVFINLFCGVLPSGIMSMMDVEEFLQLSLDGLITEAYIAENALPLALLTIYELIYYAMIFIGVWMLARSIRNIRLEKGEIRFPKGTATETVFFNAGTVALITLCIIYIAFNTFSV